MTVQKKPVTPANVGEVIFQHWRTGQNATVESVMKALGSSHRQKVNDMMAVGRTCAGDMIQTREAEAQLEGSFPQEAFNAIRDWAQQVSGLKFKEREDHLNQWQSELLVEQETMRNALEVAKEKAQGLEIQLTASLKQLSEVQGKTKQEQIMATAKCDGLEMALLDTRERVGQAEARLDVTQQNLVQTQTALSVQREQLIQVTQQRDEFNDQNKGLTAHVSQLTQQTSDLQKRLIDAEHRHQSREATWLTEHELKLRKEIETEQGIQQLDGQVASLEEQCRTMSKAYDDAEKAVATLQAEKDQLVYVQQLADDQRELDKAERKDDSRRLIELERQNAALQAELSGLKGGVL